MVRLTDDRVLVLADLVALRQVRIEVVLPVKTAHQVDLRLEAQSGADRLLDAVAVQDGQHAGHGRVDQADLGVGARAETDGGAGKQLGVGSHLGVDLEAQHDLPGTGPALDQFGCLTHEACLVRGRP